MGVLWGTPSGEQQGSQHQGKPGEGHLALAEQAPKGPTGEGQRPKVKAPQRSAAHPE